MIAGRRKGYGRTQLSLHHLLVPSRSWERRIGLAMTCTKRVLAGTKLLLCH